MTPPPDPDAARVARYAETRDRIAAALLAAMGDPQDSDSRWARDGAAYIIGAAGLMPHDAQAHDGGMMTAPGEAEARAAWNRLRKAAEAVSEAWDELPATLRPKAARLAGIAPDLPRLIEEAEAEAAFRLATATTRRRGGAIAWRAVRVVEVVRELWSERRPNDLLPLRIKADDAGPFADCLSEILSELQVRNAKGAIISARGANDGWNRALKTGAVVDPQMVLRARQLR